MSVRPEPFAPSKRAVPPIELTDDTILRERAHAPVESAIRSHFASLGGGADDATVHNATSIVLRGLTHSALSRIASAGISGTELIQTLIPPAQQGVLPAFNWSAITPAEIARLRSMGLLSERHHQMALAMRGSGEGNEGDARTSSARLDTLSHSEAVYLSEMRSHALKHGLDWAANNHDILRLGPAAIETFARMKFDKESYHALTRDAGLSPEKAHSLVKSMEAAKLTPEQANDLAKRMGATSKGLPSDQQEQHRILMENWLKANPGSAPAELGKLHRWLDERKAADPGRATTFEDEKKATIRIQEERARRLETGANADAKENKANALAAEADALLAGTPVQKAQVPNVVAPPAAPVPGAPLVQPATALNTTKPGTGSVATQTTATPPPAGPKPATPS